MTGPPTGRPAPQHLTRPAPTSRLLASLLVVLVLVALGLVGAGAPKAQAQILPPILPPPAPEENFEASGWDPEPPSRFTGSSMAVSGFFRYTPGASRTITELELVLEPEGDLPSGCQTVRVSEDPPDPAPDGSVDFAIAAPGSLCNGVYQLTVTALARSRDPADPGQEASLGASGRTVSLQPRAPTGVEATAGDDRAVAVSWDAPDNAADFLGYRLQRSVNGGTFNPIGPDLLEDTSFDDTEVPDDATEVGYKVASVRRGASGDATTTALSEATAISFTPAAPPGSDTSTTAPPGDQGDDGATASNGGGGGVSRSGPSRSVTPTTQFLPDIGRAEDDPLAEPGDRDPVLPQDDLASGTVLQNFEDDAQDRRALMVPVAIGAVLLVWALHLRFLARQAAR